MTIFLILAFAALAVAAASPSRQIPLDPREPNKDTYLVDHTFPGFAFEGHSWELFAGPKGGPVALSVNLFNEVASRIGTPPSIRVGGTSLDRAPYYPNQKEAVHLGPGSEHERIPKNMSVGPSYFDSFNNVEAEYVVMDPFALLKMDQSKEYAKAAYSTMDEKTIQLIEIGNEPDLYVGQHHRKDGYSPADYVPQFINYANSISDTVTSLGKSAPKFEAVAISWSQRGNKWQDPQSFFDKGFDKFSDRIGAISLHFYHKSVDKPSVFQTEVMNHTSIKARLTDTTSSFLPYIRKNYPKIDVVLAEAGLELDHSGGLENNLERTLGAALWQVDWMLSGITMGIARVNMQSITGGHLSLWQPVQWFSAAPEVFSRYFAQVFIADFISASPTVRATEIDLASPHLSAYAAYEAGTAKRVAIVNFDWWAGQGDRPVKNVSFKVPDGVQSVEVRRLTSSNSSSQEPSLQEPARARVRRQSGSGKGAEATAAGMEYAGLRWSVADDGRPQTVGSVETVQVGADGMVVVGVKASEAVLVVFK